MWADVNQDIFGLRIEKIAAPNSGDRDRFDDWIGVAVRLEWRRW
jgi:hypothetical protein